MCIISDDYFTFLSEKFPYCQFVMMHKYSWLNSSETVIIDTQ